MLIQFSVKNWRSVRDEQTLSMVKAKGDELGETNSFNPDISSVSELLSTAVIYGANAAGKTNLISALRAMKDIVLESANKQPGDQLPITSFLLDEETEDQPTEFEVIFVAKGVKFQYGFSASKKQIFEEWLIAYPNARPQRWFSRVWDESTGEFDWSFGAALLGQKQTWVESTRPNALFLSTATQLNSQQLKPVLGWFKVTLRLGRVAGWSPAYTASLCEGVESRVKILAFLKAADLDIKEIDVKAELASLKHFPDSLPEEVKKQILENMKDTQIYNIKTIHEGKQGQSIEFDFDNESDGTKKLFSFAGPWLDVLSKGRVLIVDELHDNLHPKLVSFLVGLFHSKETNPNNAQLIFTTHETSILNQDVFRRDQIWFCEKDKDQATRLYPLSDFSPRKGREDLEAAYLAGRYGALPYVRPIKTMEFS